MSYVSGWSLRRVVSTHEHSFTVHCMLKPPSVIQPIVNITKMQNRIANTVNLVAIYFAVSHGHTKAICVLNILRIRTFCLKYLKKKLPQNSHTRCICVQKMSHLLPTANTGLMNAWQQNIHGLQK